MRFVSSFFFALGLLGCEPLPLGDTKPPALLTTEVSPEGRELALHFDEPVSQARSEIDRSQAAPLVEGARVKVELPQGLKPGTGHVWSAEVTDEGHNVTTVAGKFYAANLRPAGLRLNEIRVAGSGTHTDMVELRVEVAGSLGGWTIEAWSSPEARQRLVLPDNDVEAGDHIVIRYKPPQETSDAAPGTREYWQTDGKGLPGTKGLILIRQRPDGPALDGLLYSKIPGEARGIASAAGWPDRTEMDPSGCTATRTWCRAEGAGAAWLVVATGSATPGAPNKLIAWEGPPSSRAVSSKTKG